MQTVPVLANLVTSAALSTDNQPQLGRALHQACQIWFSGRPH